MILTVEFGYKTFKPEDKEKYLALKEVIPSLPEWPEKGEPWLHGDHVVEMELAAGMLSELGLEFTIKPFKNNLLYSVQNELQVLSRKMRIIEARKELEGKEVISIHVPNNKLIEFNEVMVREDVCTHSLQDDLDEGWRIIAVCPPMEARRPDYIMGRYNAKRTED